MSTIDQAFLEHIQRSAIQSQRLTHPFTLPDPPPLASPAPNAPTFGGMALIAWPQSTPAQGGLPESTLVPVSSPPPSLAPLPTPARWQWVQPGVPWRTSLLWGLVAGTVMFSWVGAYALFAYQPKYSSDATVIIKDSAITANYLGAGQFAAVQTTSSNAANPVLNMMGLLSSRPVKDALWDYFRTQHPATLAEMKIRQKSEWDAFYADGKSLVKAKNLPGTDLISLQFTWNDPKIAQEALAVLLKGFQEASLGINQAEQNSRSRYLAGQVADIETRLRQLREAKSRFKTTQKTVSLSREGDELARSRMDLETQLAQMMARARGKASELREYRQMLAMTPKQALRATGLGLNPSMSRLQDQLYTLTQQEANLKATLTDKHPKVQEVGAQIAAIREAIDAEAERTVGAGADVETAVADPTRGTLVTQMATAQAELDNLNSQAGMIRRRLGQLGAEISKFPGVEAGLNNLEQEERALSSALDTLRQKELEAELKRAETLSNIFVVDTPSVPLKPKFPTVPHLLMLGLLLGLGTAGGTAWLHQRHLRTRAHAQPQPMLTPNPAAVASPAAQLPSAADPDEDFLWLGNPAVEAPERPTDARSGTFAATGSPAMIGAMFR